MKERVTGVSVGDVPDEAPGVGVGGRLGETDGLDVTVTVAAGRGEAPPSVPPQAVSRAAHESAAAMPATGRNGSLRERPATARLVMSDLGS
jgi:hypothetical protein